MRFKLRKSKGLLFVISGPSGVGKGTLLQHLIKEIPDLNFSISVTTRPPRPGEVHGVHYFFVSKEEFYRMRDEGRLLEWAEVHGNLYGTPKEFVMSKLADGHDVIMDIDVQGGKKVLTQMPDSVSVFIIPPSLDELRRRLIHRGTEDEKTIELRLRNAIWELGHAEHYRYIVMNDKLTDAIEKLKAIIQAERLRREHIEMEVIEDIEDKGTVRRTIKNVEGDVRL